VSERKAELGARIIWFFRTVARDGLVYNPYSALSVLLLFIDGKAHDCQQNKQVHLAAIAVGSSRVALG
jgi:hypothetical protein